MPNFRDKQRRDDGEVSARRYLDNAPKSGGTSKKVLHLKGFEAFDVKEKGTQAGDVIPFRAGEVCEKFNVADKGKRHWVLDFFVHQRMGINKEPIVCPLKTWKLPCPICEEHERMVNVDKEVDWKSDEARALRPQHMTALLWRPKGERKAKLWELPHFNFVEKINNELEEMDEGERTKCEFFPSPNKGMTIEARFVKDDKFSNPFYPADRITFTKRTKPVDDKVLARCDVCLDDALPKLSYKKIARIYQGATNMAKSSKEQERRKAKARDKDYDEDEDEDEDLEDEDDEDDSDDENDEEPTTADDKGIDKGDMVTYKGKECKVVKISGDGTSLTLKKGTKVYKAIGVDDVEVKDANEDDEDEDDGKASKNGKAKPKKKPKSKKEDEDEDEDDSDEDEDDDEDDDEDEPSFEKGDEVTFGKKGTCKVIKAGDTLTLKDKKGKVHKGVDPDDVTKVEEDEDDSDEDEDEDDD